MSSSKHNEDYWALNPQEKTSFHFPCHFGGETYELIRGSWGVDLFSSYHMFEIC
jgi:hypothetical protein